MKYGATGTAISPPPGALSGSPWVRGSSVRAMDTLSCPRCGTEMLTRTLSGSAGEAEISQCPDGHGVFLARADLGALVEAETDWHRNAGQHTAPLPRITPDMVAPPTSRTAARAWVETLFG